jgi:hypothetical protein
MTTDTTLAGESEQGEVNGLRAFLVRPIALLGAIALTALGVVTLGTLYNTDDSTSVAASHVASAPGTSDGDALTDGKLTV